MDAVFPLAVLVDSNEISHGWPYTFEKMKADETRHKGGGPLLVKTATFNLKWGDYSLEGFQDQIAVERKTLSDLFRTVTEGRDRFVAELEALSDYAFAAVVVEAHEDDIFRRPPTDARPKDVHRSVLAFRARYRVQWCFLADRDFSEKTTFRLLERAYLETLSRSEQKRFRY